LPIHSPSSSDNLCETGWIPQALHRGRLNSARIPVISLHPSYPDKNAELSNGVS
jgi:hypothetical protein